MLKSLKFWYLVSIQWTCVYIRFYIVTEHKIIHHGITQVKVHVSYNCFS